MPKFKFIIFDVDVGAAIHIEDHSTAIGSLDAVKSVIDSYSLDESFADKREIEENRVWNPEIIKNKFNTAVLSPFFDIVSMWLPGHHRKIMIEKIEIL